MISYSDLLSFFIGLGIGFLYGLSFLFQGKKALSLFKLGSKKVVFFRAVTFFALRIIILAIILFILLPLKFIKPIIVVLGFIVAFWTLIIMKKAAFYESS